MPEPTESTAAPVARAPGGGMLFSEEGQTLAEYALILTLIAVAVVAAVVLLSGQIGGLWSDIQTHFNNL